MGDGHTHSDVNAHPMAQHHHLAPVSHHERGSEDETKVFDTGQGLVKLSIFEEGVPPRFRVHFTDLLKHQADPPAEAVVEVETLREVQGRQRFTFEPREGYLEATDVLPEPHEFAVVLTIAQGVRVQTYKTQFD